MRESFSKVQHITYAIVVYLSLAAIELRNVASGCNRRTVGLFGDGFGTMWASWVQTQQAFPPWRSWTNFVSFPGGEPFWTFEWWTSVLVRLPLQLMSRVFGPICGYNIMVAFGYLFSSMSMWLLVYWVTKQKYISILAGAMFGFGPFIQSAMTGHIDYMYIGAFPTLMYLLIRLRQRSNWGQIFSGLAIGSLTYVDGYFFVPASIAVSLVFLSQVRTSLWNNFKIKSLKLIQIRFFVSYGLLQIPLLALYFLKSSTGAQIAPPRDWNELNVYSIKAWHLILPSPSNMYYGSIFRIFETQHLGGSNFSETGLYPGLAFILLAIYALFRRTLKPWSQTQRNAFTAPQISPEISKQIKWFALFLLFGIWLSMRPWIHILGIRFPFPSGILFHILPAWRTISRWGLISTTAIITLGSIGAALLLQRKSKTLTFMILLILTGATILDLGFPNTLNPKVVAAIQQTGPYAWLNKNTSRDAVVLDVVPYSVDGFFTGMALTTKRKMANSLAAPATSKTLELLYPGRPEFLCNVNSTGINYVVIHPLFYNPARKLSLPGFIKVKEFHSDSQNQFSGWYNSYIYKPEKNYKSNFQVNYRTGFDFVGDGAWSGSWYLKKSIGDIQIENVIPEDSRDVKINFISKFFPEKIKIMSKDRNIFIGTIPTDKPVGLKVPIQSEINLSVVRLDTPMGNLSTSPNLSVEVEDRCWSMNGHLKK